MEQHRSSEPSGSPPDLWSEQDTSPDAIEAALRRLLHQRYVAGRLVAPARILNLVVVADGGRGGDIAARLAGLGRYDASRTILCLVEDGGATLDATARISCESVSRRSGDEAPGPGVVREDVEIRLSPRHLDRLDTIVGPVLASGLPTVLWCPHGHEAVRGSLRELTDVVLLDSDADAPPAVALATAEELTHALYVVDLAWLRTTPWRERLAYSFDPPGRRPALARIAQIAVRHQSASAASGLLLLGWLASRLGWQPGALRESASARLCGTARVGKREAHVSLAGVEQQTPGLAGATVGCTDGFVLSFDRGRGGLHVSLCAQDGRRSAWTALGASRGERGILREGLRQAVLRDPTYAPAVEAALEFLPRRKRAASGTASLIRGVGAPALNPSAVG